MAGDLEVMTNMATISPWKVAHFGLYSKDLYEVECRNHYCLSVANANILWYGSKFENFIEIWKIQPVKNNFTVTYK